MRQLFVSQQKDEDSLGRLVQRVHEDSISRQDCLLRVDEDVIALGGDEGEGGEELAVLQQSEEVDGLAETDAQSLTNIIDDYNTEHFRRKYTFKRISDSPFLLMKKSLEE